VEIASRFISYQKRPDRDVFLARRKAGASEAARLARHWLGSREKPDLWFTYHPYCKAPDWIGPAVAAALSIPYATAEACRTRQGNDADWEEARAAVQAAVRMAAVNLCLKPSDEAYLRSVLPARRSIVGLRPFLDARAVPDDAAPIDPEPFFARPAPLIVTVGMMRPGLKIQSYRLLAESLSGLTDLTWNLAIIGDGPERGTVERMFAFAAGVSAGTESDAPRASPIQAVPRVHFTGALSRPEVFGWMKAGDLLAWPGIGEAIGMVYLEAQACGLPVAACDVAGVRNVVEDGKGGLLSPAPTALAYRAVLARLLGSDAERKARGADGLRRVKEMHDLSGAAAVMKAALDPLIGGERLVTARRADR
jgi:glycosyltransferase involved in cell wall biosynthesis